MIKDDIKHDSYIKELVKKAREAKLHIDVNRALFLTESYKKTEGEPVVIRQAKGLKHILENMPINIEEGELIVGSQTYSPLGVSLYPEYASRWIEDTLDELPKRSCEPTEVDANTKKILREKIFPYWRGKSLHEVFWSRCSPYLRKILFFDEDHYPPKSNAIQNLGAMATQGIGHVIFNPKLFCGFLNIAEQVKEKLHNTSNEQSKQFYEAVLISIDAVVNWSRRYSKLANELAEKTSDVEIKKRLLKIAEICNRMPTYAPETFHEALQYFWLVWVAAYIAEDGIGYSTGPIDEYLYPYYKKDIEKGILTEEEAYNLIKHLFVKFGWLTYGLKTDDAAIHHTGLRSFHFEIGRPPKKGRPTVNELSYQFINAMIELRLNNPAIRVHLSKENPEDFLDKVVELIKTGIGHPSIFNTDLEVKYWLEHKISEDETRDCTFCACVTPTLYGDSGYNYMGYLNAPAILIITLNNGFWKYNGKLLGPNSGNPRNFTKFEDVLDAYRKQVRHVISASVLSFNLLMQCHAELRPSPYTSMFIDGCSDNGLDKTWGGAKYNFPPHPVCVGVPDVINSFAVIKKFIYDEKQLNWDDLLTAIDENFIGRESLRQMLLNKAPKWGNDDDYVDGTAKQVIAMLREEYDKVTQVCYIGRGPRDIAFASLGSNIPFGKAVGALPWGKRAEDAVSDGIGPNSGTDKSGPTAIFKSMSKIDWAKTGFGILNIMFTPSAAEPEALVNFLKAFVELGIPHVQFNVFDKDTLRDAQKYPEKYRGLIVRVSGYCAYFVELSKELQEDIIARTTINQI